MRFQRVGAESGFDFGDGRTAEPTGTHGNGFPSVPEQAVQFILEGLRNHARSRKALGSATTDLGRERTLVCHRNCIGLRA